MSSPVHYPDDLDTALIYAPPWARGPRAVPPLHAGAPGGAEPRRAAPVERGEFSGDRAMLRLRRQLALDPDVLPEPPRRDERGMGPLVLRFGAVMAAAAFVAAGMVWLTAPKPEPMKDQTASAAVEAAAPSAAVHRVQLVLFRPATEPLPAVETFADRAASPVLAPPAPAPAPPSAALVSGLDDDEIATLLKRGQDFVQTGDFASARLLLRRAAEAGSADAALALGATYDPGIIRQRGVIGIEPDAARARSWYQRAAELGSTAATGQLANLEQVR